MIKTRLLLDWLRLDRSSKEPLYGQLTDQLRRAMARGDLTKGSTLPSSRTLAGELGVSRNTVLRVYEQLLAEGLLEAAPGSGTVVAADTRAKRLGRQGPQSQAASGTLPPVSSVLNNLNSSVPWGESFPDSVAFAPGAPAFDRFPTRTWVRLLAAQSKRMRPDMASEDAHTGGYGPLREALALYLRAARQVECNPDQVFVVSTARAGLEHICKLIAEPGDAGFLEDPGYISARYVMQAAGLRVVPTPVDGEGIRIDLGERDCPAARLAYVTPSHQYPTGVSLSARRRRDLLDWAQRRGAVIVEDDYDSEFHFASPPLETLQGMDGGHHVFYLGTCAKVLFPSLRVAYVVVPRKYLREFSTTVSYLGRQPPLHVQAALCDFITGGYFHAHIRRMRRLYERRQSILVQALQHGLEGHVAVEKPAGGMQLVLRLPARFSAGRVCAEATARGLLALDIERYCVRCDVPNALFLGFAAVPEAEMDVAAAKLSDAIIASAQVVP